jgi:hypothetical protein
LSDRTGTVYRIAELIIRYRAAELAGKWRVRDGETGELLAAEYSDEAMARSGARLQAACDILDLTSGVR